MEKFYEKCKKHQLKITPQRVAVYQAVRSSLAHPSADVIHKNLKKQFPNISLDTVNRTLITFAKVNIIDVVEGHGDPRRFDPNQEEHHHFYCLSCNQIFDFHDVTIDETSIPEEIRKKFTITGKRICLQGYCEKCSSQSSEL